MLMVISTMDNGRNVRDMAKEDKILQMEKSTMVNGLKVRCMAKEN